MHEQNFIFLGFMLSAIYFNIIQHKRSAINASVNSL